MHQHPALLIILLLIILSSLSRTPTFHFLYTVLQQTSLDDYFAADHHHHYQEPTLIINSISGTLNPFSASAILRLRHLPRFSETELEHSLMFVFWVSVWDALWPRLHIIPNVPKERILGLPHRKNLKLVKTPA